MSGDHPYLVCVPVAALASPGAGSVQSVCQTCEQLVWVSVESMMFIRRNPAIYIVCNNCAIEAIGADNFTAERVDMRVVPGAPRWTKKMLRRLRQRDDIADVLRVKDLGD